MDLRCRSLVMSKFSVSGFDGLDKALAKLAGGIPESRMRALLHEGGEIIAAEAGASAYDIARELGYGGTKSQWLASLNGAVGKNAAAVLGSVTITQTATVAISAGTRRMVVTIPTSWGVVAGDPLVAFPGAAIAGYAVHDVVAVSPTSLSIGITAPLLGIGASFSIPCRIARLNT